MDGLQRTMDGGPPKVSTKLQLVKWLNTLVSSPWVKDLLNDPAIVSFDDDLLEVAVGRSILSAGRTRGVAVWLSILAVTVATTSHIQDFGDIEDHMAAGRDALPITIGYINARMIPTFGIPGWTLVTCHFRSEG